jgi:hypothetical protein
MTDMSAKSSQGPAAHADYPIEKIVSAVIATLEAMKLNNGKLTSIFFSSLLTTYFRNM